MESQRNQNNDLVRTEPSPFHRVGENSTRLGSRKGGSNVGQTPLKPTKGTDAPFDQVAIVGAHETFPVMQVEVLRGRTGSSWGGAAWRSERQMLKDLDLGIWGKDG